MNDVIVLKQQELDMCRAFAIELYKRHKETSQSALVDQKYNVGGDGDGTQRINLDYAAKAAEMAVGNYLETIVNFNINSHKGGDGGFDLTILEPDDYGLDDRPRITIDVKHSTHLEAERLIWPLGKPMNKMADVLVFATTGIMNSELFGTFTLHGWITSWQFKKLHIISQYGDVLKVGTQFMYNYTLTPMKYLRHN